VKDEIQKLWSEGILTTGSCCGHNIGNPMINVSEDSIEHMERLGYQHITWGNDEQNRFTFTPKTLEHPNQLNRRERVDE
jgi:hypothetical protein